MARSFVHLHVHTEYSMLDGASRIGDVVAAAAQDGQPAIGITDHGNMYGVLDMYQAAREAGIIPIIGTELYQAFEHRTERLARRNSKVDDSGGEVEGGRKAYYHLTALAETLTGYRNLIQLSSRAYLEGYYQKPKVDWELLADHHEGIIATTGCLGGQVLQALLKDDEAGALAVAGRLQDIFGRDSLFVELQDHGIADQQRTNPKLMEIARRIDAPLLATNDSHYTHQGDAMAHDALAVRADEREDPRGEPLQVPRRPALLEARGGDAQPLRRGARGVRLHALDRRAGERRARVRQPSAAELPGAGGPHREDLPARAHDGGREGALRPFSGTRGARATGARAQRHRVDGLLRLLPHRVGHRPLREVARDPGRAGAGERGRILRRVLPAHRGHRSDQVRPAVRAVPQPGSQADARHRHGLRLPLSRRDDQVRVAALRRGPRCADRDVLHHQGASRSARRGPGARLPVRSRRQDREAHAAADHGA